MSKFITNQNIELDFEYASLGDRIVATLIDALVIGAYTIAIIFIASILQAVGAGNFGVFLVILMIVPILFYNLLFEIFGEGQTIGKKVRKIKVVKIDGSSPRISSYLLRWILRPIDISSFYGAVAMICISSSKRSQRLGDMAAGTTVINTSEKIRLQEVVSVTEENHEVTFYQVKRLNDNQIELIRKALKMRAEGNNEGGVPELVVKIKELLVIESDLPDVKFLHTIIKDYEYLSLIS